MKITNEIAFTIGSIVGLLFGLGISGILASGKIEDSWHNGFRAGKYGKDNSMSI